MLEDSRQSPESGMLARAHLKDKTGFSPPIHLFNASAASRSLVSGFWVPVWSIPDGFESVQRVLQYPVCQLVVSTDYAHLVGPRRGMSTKVLAGTGWAFGASLTPATGSLVLGQAPIPVDADLDLDQLSSLDFSGYIDDVRDALIADPADNAAHLRCAQRLERLLQQLPPLDAEGHLINEIVNRVETDADVVRVGDICREFGIGERTLQRLCKRRIGLEPAWLIRRRRLHEAAFGITTDTDDRNLAELAATLGYADQAHLSRDFKAVIGVSPTTFATQRHSGLTDQ